MCLRWSRRWTGLLVKLSTESQEARLEHQMFAMGDPSGAKAQDITVIRIMVGLKHLRAVKVVILWILHQKESAELVELIRTPTGFPIHIPLGPNPQLSVGTTDPSFSFWAPPGGTGEEGWRGFPHDLKPPRPDL
ncbi:hypothetical protein ATANTOWER_025130 [Ataeniobius toweri]|uniref:Uncharacterized protein n=1 Tax=Ataeniobius toweri TaxID=208326 RepID=A0ABU7ALW7_9TELE|nr:hypothetical protein [Ataeniobius toweri]